MSQAHELVANLCLVNVLYTSADKRDAKPKALCQRTQYKHCLFKLAVTRSLMYWHMIIMTLTQAMQSSVTHCPLRRRAASLAACTHFMLSLKAVTACFYILWYRYMLTHLSSDGCSLALLLLCSCCSCRFSLLLASPFLLSIRSSSSALSVLFGFAICFAAAFAIGFRRWSQSRLLCACHVNGPHNTSHEMNAKHTTHPPHAMILHAR